MGGSEIKMKKRGHFKSKSLSWHLFYFTTGSAGALFGTGVCISALLRGGKDDWINHFVGGAIVASLFGYKREYRRHTGHLLTEIPDSDVHVISTQSFFHRQLGNL